MTVYGRVRFQSKNYVSSLNDSIRKSKVSEQNQGNTKTVMISKAIRKIKKLQSNRFLDVEVYHFSIF